MTEQEVSNGGRAAGLRRFARGMLWAVLAFMVAPAHAQSLTPEPSGQAVHIVVFGAFGCAYCARTVPVLDELLRRHPGRIAVQYRHFPLGEAESDLLPHEAALAAAAQGQFGAMYHALYAASAPRDDAALALLAAGLHLDLARFREDLRTHAWRPRIRDDVDTARALGVKVTPTLFVQGYKLEGVPSAETLEVLVERALKLADAATTGGAPER